MTRRGKKEVPAAREPTRPLTRPRDGKAKAAGRADPALELSRSAMSLCISEEGPSTGPRRGLGWALARPRRSPDASAVRPSAPESRKLLAARKNKLDGICEQRDDVEEENADGSVKGPIGDLRNKARGAEGAVKKTCSADSVAKKTRGAKGGAGAAPNNEPTRAARSRPAKEKRRARDGDGEKPGCLTDCFLGAVNFCECRLM